MINRLVALARMGKKKKRERRVARTTGMCTSFPTLLRDQEGAEQRRSSIRSTYSLKLSFHCLAIIILTHERVKTGGVRRLPFKSGYFVPSEK